MIKKAILLSLICVLLSSCSLSNLRTVQTSHKAQNVESDQQSNTEQEDSQQMIEDFTPADLKIATIGDSLTKGIGDHTVDGGYQSTLSLHLEKDQKIKDISISHDGKKGLTSKGLAKKIENEDVMNVLRQANVIVITIGGNDVMKVVRQNFKHVKTLHFKLGMDEYEKNVRKILTSIRENNKDADIYLIGLYNPFDKWFGDIKEFDDIMVEWNERSENITKSYKDVYFVEISKFFMNREENLIYEEDYFHPNTKGYELMGNAVYEELQKHTISPITQQAKK